MKGGLLNPPNAGWGVRNQDGGPTSMKGGLLNPPNRRTRTRRTPRTLDFNEGGVIEPPEPPSPAASPLGKHHFNEGGVIEPPEPLALNVRSDLLVCGRLRAVVVRKHFLGRIQLSRSVIILGFMRFRALSGISQLTSALASQDDWAAGRQGDGYSHELEAVSAPLARVSDVDHSNGVFGVMDDLS